MKIVAISDLHGHLPTNLPSGDVLCICGDIVPLMVQSNTVNSSLWFHDTFIPWAKGLPFSKVVFCGGNHDFFLENLTKVRNSPSETMSAFEVWAKKLQNDDAYYTIMDYIVKPIASKKIIYLSDESTEIEGKVFYGIPWVASLTNWAFYLPERELQEKWDEIPEKVDVLLTHMPCNLGRVGTVCQLDTYNTMRDFGSPSLSEALNKKDIKWNICGHVHTGTHIPVEYKPEHFAVNCSILNEDYKPAYSPLVFEI